MLLSLLGTTSDDPAYSSTILDPLLQAAIDGLLTDILLQNPDYLASTATITAASSTSHTYNVGSQQSTFARWLSVRMTDENGAHLREAQRYDDLDRAGPGYFIVSGIDSSAVLTTSADTTAGVDLWLRFQYWPTALGDDSDVPGGIPLRFHDVIPLEACFVFGLGGEGRRPPELAERWMTRRGQLLHWVGKRGPQNTRTRLDADEDYL